MLLRMFCCLVYRLVSHQPITGDTNSFCDFKMLMSLAYRSVGHRPAGNKDLNDEVSDTTVDAIKYYRWY